MNPEHPGGWQNELLANEWLPIEDLRTQANVVAQARQGYHNGSPKERLYCEDGFNQHYIGLMGEIPFAHQFRVPMDWSLKPSGDDGFDFRLYDGNKDMWVTVDVKTARKPWHLLVDPREIRAHVFVLAKYDEMLDWGYLIGWETHKVVRQAPEPTFRLRSEVKPHCIHASKLRPMQELKAWFDKRRTDGKYCYEGYSNKSHLSRQLL